MSQKRYWSLGIEVRYRPERMETRDARCFGSLKFYDDGGDDGTDAGRVSTFGELHTCYFVRPGLMPRAALRTVTDTLLEKASDLEIEFRDPTLYPNYEDDRLRTAPRDWRDAYEREAERLGWGLPGPPDEMR